MTCNYTNNSDRYLIVKITDSNSNLERIVLPHQTLNFSVDNKNAYLEVYSYEFITMILTDKIICSELCD